MATLINERLKRRICDRQYREMYYPEGINKIIDEIENGNIKDVIRRNEYLKFVFSNYKLSKGEIDYAIDSLSDKTSLYELFANQILNDEQITSYLETVDLREHWNALGSLLIHQVLNERHIDILLKKYESVGNKRSDFASLCLGTLSQHQKLSQQQISKIISLAKGLTHNDLYHLYTNHKLSPNNINKAISKGKELDVLYKHQIKGKGKLKFIPKT